MLQNANIDQRIPRFVSSLDSCLYKILSTDDLLQKGEIINRFLNENMNFLNELQNNFFINFAFSFINQIRQKIDKYIKKLESITEVNLHTNPELIAAQQLLIDFFTPEISANKGQTNNANDQSTPNSKMKIPEPVDFVSIYKDAFTKLKLEKITPKADYKFLNDYYLTYKAIFSIVKQIPQFQQFKNDFQPVLSAEKLPLKYTFKMNSPKNSNSNSNPNIQDSENSSITEKELSFTVHSTVYDAKVQLAKDLGVPSNSITLKYDVRHKSNEENANPISTTENAANSTEINNSTANNASNTNNRTFFYNSHKSNNKNNVYYNINNNNNNKYGDVPEINSEINNSNNNDDKNDNNSISVLINDMFLVHYKSYMPFIVEFVPPPPKKYHFITPVRNVSKSYDYSKTVADVKSDLRSFLQHEVQLKFKGKLLDDHQKLSILNIGNDIIEVTYTPDYKFKPTTGEIVIGSFQSNTTMFKIYSIMRQKFDYNFLLFFRKKFSTSSTLFSPNKQPTSKSEPSSEQNLSLSSPTSNSNDKTEKVSRSNSNSDNNLQISPSSSLASKSSRSDSSNDQNLFSPPSSTSNSPFQDKKPSSLLNLKLNSRSDAKFDLSPDSSSSPRSGRNYNGNLDLSMNSRSDIQFNLNQNNDLQNEFSSPRVESNYELAVEYSELIGNRNEIRVVEVLKKILLFFKFPSNSIRQILFDENDTVETAKNIIRKIIVDQNTNIPNLDYLNNMDDKANFKIINSNYNSINLNNIQLNEGDDFILMANKKPLQQLTLPLSSIQCCNLISIQTTDSLLIQLLVSNGERYEIQLSKTATVKEAKIEASSLFNCEFAFMKKEKVMKDTKLIILLSTPQIRVEMPNQVYQFQFPNGKMKKHEFSPTLKISEIKKFIANHQKCNVESIQLSAKGKELNDKNFLYDVDINSIICVNVFITLPFFISSKNKQSKKSLSFDINSTFKNVRQYLSEKTKHALDKLSFFDENEIFINDDKKLVDMANQKMITAIIHQKNPEFNESDIKKIDELVASINLQVESEKEKDSNSDNVSVNRESLLALFVKCGLNLNRLQKNLSFFMKNKLLNRLNDIV